MDWGNIIGIIAAALAVAIGIPLALRRRKKESSQKVESFLAHLQAMGIKVSLLEKGSEPVKTRQSLGQKVEGFIKVEGQKIDYIKVTSISSQYGVNFFLDYLVKKAGVRVMGSRKIAKTKLAKKKDSFIRGKVVDIEWKGDAYFSRELNYDYRLKDKLLQVDLNMVKEGITVYPEPKQEYARVRTGYVLPSPELFQAVDMIARHIKSVW